MWTTGVGSMPGTDPAESARIVAGELDVPHVPELPARGPGSDMIGRTLGIVVATTGEFAGETTPTGWRLPAGRAGGEIGRQMRRAQSWLAEDLDMLAEQLVGFQGTVKVQVAGPWTLAASVESARGVRLVADAGHCAELAVALGESLAAHLADVSRRVPGAALVVQLDEPLLPVVMAGRVRPPAGRGALRRPDVAELTARLGASVAAATAAGARVAAHCCAGSVPFGVLRRAGIGMLSVDVGALGTGADEHLGAWWDAGGEVLLGVAPSVDDPRVSPERLARVVSGMWHRIGFGVGDVGSRTWLTPACGLAGASPAYARAVGGVLGRAAALLDSAE